VKENLHPKIGSDTKEFLLEKCRCKKNKKFDEKFDVYHYHISESKLHTP
jgi:hypothetical protein